jgi:hypothetical protein
MGMMSNKDIVIVLEEPDICLDTGAAGGECRI